MRQEYKNRTYYFWFDSFSEMSELVEPIWDFCSSTKWGIRNQNKLGRTLYSYKDVQHAINSYWDYGMSIYEQMKNKLNNYQLKPPQNIRRRSSWSEDNGDEICLDRLKYGQPYWRTTIRDHRPGPINVTIVSDIATSSRIHPDEALWRGAASVLLTELLEEAGYRIELWAVERVTENYFSQDHFSAGVLLKRPEDVLDTSTLVNCVSSWSHRTVFFAARNLAKRKSHSILGYPSDPEVKIYTPDQQAILCKNIWSEQAAVNWIKQQLEKFASGEFAVQP